MTKTSIVALVTGAVLIAALLLVPAAAWAADEFVKVEGAVQQRSSPVPFIAGAYGFIWVAVLAYVVHVARGLRKVKDDLADARRRLDRA